MKSVERVCVGVVFECSNDGSVCLWLLCWWWRNSVQKDFDGALLLLCSRIRSLPRVDLRFLFFVFCLVAPLPSSVATSDLQTG